MFVQSNTLSATKSYFTQRLSEHFSANEIKTMFGICTEKRLGFSAAEIILNEEARLSESDLLYYRSVVKRLLQNEPFQYIIGETLFYDLIFKTDPRALIPRPETEELIFEIVNLMKVKPLKIIDLCTGSGCIALALKKQFPLAEVFGVDISTDALALASENGLGLKLAVNWIQSDVLSNDLPTALANVDLLVSNPPYIPEIDKLNMHANVLDFEPELALFVEDDRPFVFYERIAEMGRDLLNENGWIAFEIHERFGMEMIQILGNFNYRNIDLKMDLQGRNRMLFAQK